MSEKKEKKKESKKVKGEGDEKEGKSTKETKDAKSKKDKDKDKDKDNPDGGNKKGGTSKEGEKKIAATKEADKKAGVATTLVDPDAPPPLDADGNPIRVQPDPKPTFAELWFDDPVEGEYAQKKAMELRGSIEVKALSIRQYLEGAIVPLLLQGLEHMVLERPTNAAEYLAAFLLRNNPLRDVEWVEPPDPPPPTELPPKVAPPKCSCCKVHCPPSPTEQEPVPEFFRKGDKSAPAEISKKDEKVAQTQFSKKAS